MLLLRINDQWIMVWRSGRGIRLRRFMPLKHEAVSSTLVAVSIGSGEYR